MAASQPAAPRRRPRRGSVDRPINARLYRAAFLFAVVPLLVLAFTVSTPTPLPAPALPSTFDTPAAVTLARTLADSYPDRAPGTPGAGDGRPLSGATRWVRRQLVGYGLLLSTSSWSANVPGHGPVELTNVEAVVPGQSPSAIVVTAHRDDLGIGPGADDDATGTAVLIELARAFAQPNGVPRPSLRPAHTLIFLSTDGGSFGSLGAVHFLATSHYRSHMVAVVNLEALAGPNSAALEIAGDRPRSPSRVLLATAAARVAEQTGSGPRHVGLLGQLIDLGFPLALFDQGPFLAAGIPALTLTTGGPRPPGAAGDVLQALDVQRLGQMGEAAQNLVGSLEQDVALAGASSSYVWVGGRTISGWAIELVLISLLMPFAVAVVDVYALCRRNRIALAPAVRALRSRLGFWLFAGAVFTCFRLLGAWPDQPARPPNPANPLTSQLSLLALIGLGVLLVGGWAIERQRLAVRRPVSAEEQLAGSLTALVALLLVSLLVAATNPFGLLFVLPALHAWLWLPQLRTSRAPARVAVFAAGLVGPALLVGSLAWRLGLGFDAPWYLFELVANGYLSTLGVLIALAGTAAACQLAALSAGRYAPYPGVDERGPRGPVRELVRTVALAVRPRRVELRGEAVRPSYRAR